MIVARYSGGPHGAELMAASRAIAVARRVGDDEAEGAARVIVDHAKRGLGERGPVWWTDGAPDFNRHLARTSPYRDWFARLAEGVDSDPAE